MEEMKTTRIQLTVEQIMKANEKNACYLDTCPHCHCDVTFETVEKSKKYITDAWVSSCPKCNYSFTD